MPTETVMEMMEQEIRDNANAFVRDSFIGISSNIERGVYDSSFNNVVPEYRAPNIIPYKPTVSADPILAARLTEIENKLNRILEYLEA